LVAVLTVESDGIVATELLVESARVDHGSVLDAPSNSSIIFPVFRVVTSPLSSHTLESFVDTFLPALEILEVVPIGLSVDM